MKVILSRKGFDSTSGGHPSPVFSNGTMLSMPIPVHPKDNFETPYCCLKLPEGIQLPSEFGECVSYSEIINRLYGGNPSYYYEEKENDKKVARKIQTEYCHPDPDLLNYKGCTKGGKWKGLFGQTGISESHLRNQKVCVDDLFLFFGRFQHVCNDGKIEMKGREFHAIWGYMQVGRVYRDKNIVKQLECDHPHKNDKHFRNAKGKITANTVYEARDFLTFADGVKGADIFDYHSKRELTKNDSKLVSVWDMPDCFEGYGITYHKEKCGKNFKSTGRGQEFVIQKDFNMDRNIDFFDRLMKDVFFDK